MSPLLCPPNVRIAIESDAEELFAFVAIAHEEHYVPKSLDKIAETVERAVTRKSNPVFGLIKGVSGIEAAIGLSFTQPWLSDSAVLTNFFYSVHPEHRRTGHANDLVDFGAWLGQQLRMPFILTEWSHGEESGRLRLFKRRGERIGAMFAVGAAA